MHAAWKLSYLIRPRLQFRGTVTVAAPAMSPNPEGSGSPVTTMVAWPSVDRSTEALGAKAVAVRLIDKNRPGVVQNTSRRRLAPTIHASTLLAAFGVSVASRRALRNPLA
jgi:hypothetical protein